MQNPEFSGAKQVADYTRRFSTEALTTLLDETWKTQEFHNMKALLAAINAEIRKAKSEVRSKREEDERPKILEKINTYTLKTSRQAWTSDWDAFTGNLVPFAAAFIGIVDTKKAQLICRKLALVEIFDPATAARFLQQAEKLAQARRLNLPYDWVGIGKTLGMITSDLPGQPADYSPFDGGGQYFDAFYGISKQGGIPLSFQGITSELDAILHVHPDELAKDEVVFSGSKYTDEHKGEMNKDVDVSYIDSAGVLHLIENGKDMNTLKNKAVGVHDQKRIYMHLSQKTTSFIHAPVAPLTEAQAGRNQITGVQWWYAIPAHALDIDHLRAEDKITLSAVAAAGAGLRCADRRLTPEMLRKLCKG
ncbi:hypothetical protein [Pandoraea anhela]|uniref:Uncharacterized protein n=1 Tax=Pandoraea anhela TaxID=2508295 RepID=A0A5E4RY40_9BURK|nr:hypothetical protein [Pandoraea anhela]VVD68187.1 hypothetical protein PAN31108_00475 [Pandoraea anhela]